MHPPGRLYKGGKWEICDDQCFEVLQATSNVNLFKDPGQAKLQP